MPKTVSATMKWFENLAVATWAAAYWSKVDVIALSSDPNYGRKRFLQYACTRKGAPHALEVAGIKAVTATEKRGEPPSRIRSHFANFYNGKLKDNYNPIADSRFAKLDIPTGRCLTETG